MKKDKVGTFILLANAVLLVVGTIAETTNSPYKMMVMSVLFIAWLVLFAWRVTAFSTVRS